MEMTMKMGTLEVINNCELVEIDGGSVGTAIGMTAAAVAIAWAAPVGLIVGSGWAAGALALGGAGMIGKITGTF